MSAAVILSIGLAALSQCLLGRWMDSPWFVPDLTVISVMLAILMEPERALGPALLGGFLTMVLSDRQALLSGIGYLGVGWFVRFLAIRWDMTGLFIQALVIGTAETWLLTLTCLGTVAVTPGLVLLTMAKTAVTILCLPGMRRVVPLPIASPRAG